LPIEIVSSNVFIYTPARIRGLEGWLHMLKLHDLESYVNLNQPTVHKSSMAGPT